MDSSSLPWPLGTLRALFGDPPVAKRPRPHPLNSPFVNSGIPFNASAHARDRALFFDPQYRPVVAAASAAQVRRYALTQTQRWNARPLPPLTAGKALPSDWKERFRLAVERVYSGGCVDGKGNDAIDDDAPDDGDDAQDGGDDDKWLAGAEAALGTVAEPPPSTKRPSCLAS